MKRRPLGRDGFDVGAVAFGCMSFGGFYGPTDERESHAALARALDLGVDHLDTSNVYGAGVSETVIGTFLRDNGGRDRFRIATKAGITRKPEHPFDNSPAYLRECLEGSLRRLGVEHVDLFYVHRREQARPIEEVMEALVRLKEEGKLSGIGLSEVAPSTLARAAAVHPVMAVQSEYSLWTRLPELGMIQACERHGATLVAFSPVARGMLTDSQPDPASLPESDFRKANPRFVEPNLSHNRAAIGRFRAFARAKGYPTATLAIAWVLSRGRHIVALPGTRSAAHLDELATGAAVTLTDADLAEIEAILPCGFAHGARYTAAQNLGPESFC